MARRSVISSVIAVVALTAFTACGDDDGTATTEPPTSGAPATSVDILDSMLLEVGDLPSGWQVGSPINEMDLKMNVEVCPGTVLNTTIAERLDGDTGIQFEPSSGAYEHLLEQLNSGDPARLSADLDAYRGAVQACIDASVAPADITADTMAMAELAIPDVGDQSFAFAGWALESADGPVWYLRTAMVRVGSVAVSLGAIEILDTADAPVTMTDEQFVGLLETAVDRVAG